MRSGVSILVALVIVLIASAVRGQSGDPLGGVADSTRAAMAPVDLAAVNRARAGVAPSDSAAADSTSVSSLKRHRFPPAVVIPPAPFAVVAHDAYLLRHAITLDHWLDRSGGWFLTRQGPLGRDASLSRWGMGAGRALVTVDGVVLNNPQTGIAPLAHIPVSGMQQIRFDDDNGSALINPMPIEGWLDLEEFEGPEERARVFLELSNGDRALRQRRVRFSSVRGMVGIDLGYDEVLNQGYWFDGSGQIPFAQEFGQAQSRHVSSRLRGEFESGERWSIGFRRFVGDARSDLTSASSEQRRNGHLATASAQLGRIDLNIFERGFDFSDPDSHTVNSTRGVFTTIRAVTVRGASLTIKGGVEDIVAEQNVGGAQAINGIRRIAASAEGGKTLGARTVLRVAGSWSGYWRRDGGWGVTLDLRHSRGGHAVVASARRTFRLPSLGELFVPAHTTNGRTLVGDRNVGDEQAVELGVRVESRMDGFHNELRASTIRMNDAIAFLPSAAHGADWRVAANSDAVSLLVLEERAAYRGNLGPFHYVLDGSATWAPGDRDGFFATVPEVRVAAGARLGFELFQNTSALYVNLDGVASSARRDAFGAELPRWSVVNAIGSARLVDAHFYFGMLNALGEEYRTQGNYLMPPRTLVYGIYWTLFN